MSKPINNSRFTFHFSLFTFYLTTCLLPTIARSQPIVPAADGTNTQVVPQGNQFNIQGGQLSEDGANLFHSFDKFGLTDGQIANFLSNPNIQNILGRVTGGDASIINGLIRVTGGNANLFLLNPSGIIFGSNAKIDVPGSFFPTEASAIGFDNGTWFNAVGDNNWSELVGTPDKLQFEIGDRQNPLLSSYWGIGDGEGLTIDVLSGAIALQSFPNENAIRISREGNVLSLEIPLPESSVNFPSQSITSLSLPALLTNGKINDHANGVIVNDRGQLVFVGSEFSRLQNRGLERIAHPLDRPQNANSIIGALDGDFIAINGVSLLQQDLLENSQFYLTSPTFNEFNSWEAGGTNVFLGGVDLRANGSIQLPSLNGEYSTLNFRENATRIVAPTDSEGTSINGYISGIDGTMQSQFPSINNRINFINLDRSILQIEGLWSQQFADLLQEDIPQIQSAASITEMLGKIENQTGQKPAIIYAIAEPTQLILMAIAPGKSIVKSVSVSRKDLLSTAKEFRIFVSNRRTNSYKKTAKELYNLLIEPINKDLQDWGINTLIFSLDSGLRSIPIAALYDGDKFLVEEFSIALIPSVSLTDASYKGLENSQILAMGASEFTDLDPLPAVPVELAEIASIWQQDKTVFLNQEFTLKNLKEQRQQHQIVHLATHADFRSADDSYIQLGNAKLKLEQLRDLNWHESPTVELLVLSACRTAIGDEETEMGFAGLSVRAGVKSALASLWLVSDEGTLAFMTQFYQQLRKAPIKATALQEAQIAMLRGQVRFEAGKLHALRSGKKITLPPELTARLGPGNIDLSHPSYWAGFTLIGSPW